MCHNDFSLGPQLTDSLFIRNGKTTDWESLVTFILEKMVRFLIMAVNVQNQSPYICLDIILLKQSNVLIFVVWFSSGEYIFAISSDGNSEFWLSENESPEGIKILAFIGKVKTCEPVWLNTFKAGCFCTTFSFH